MKHHVVALALAITTCGASQAQIAPANARPDKVTVNDQVPAELNLPKTAKGYVWAQIPAGGKADFPGYAAGTANDEMKALLKAQTEAIKALSSKVEGLEARLTKVEVGRK
jgi:hypothetical protein